MCEFRAADVKPASILCDFETGTDQVMTTNTATGAGTEVGPVGIDEVTAPARR